MKAVVPIRTRNQPMDFRWRLWMIRCFVFLLIAMIDVFRSNLVLPNQDASGASADSGPATRMIEDWHYMQNADLRIGLLRSHGGALAYLSPADSPVNVLNHFDHGRLIQQSYYGDADESRWVNEPWRYNPVQGGDYQGLASKLEEFTATENSVYVKTTPRHWATGELLTECTMEQWIELHGPVVKMRFKFHYAGNQTHDQRHQETPAMFVAPELTKLVSYDRDQPWSDGEVSHRIPGWPNESVGMTENWVAYVGPDGRGVGIFVPGVTEATAYRFQGGSGSDCSYVAPLKTFALTPGLTYSYTAYLTLGDVPTIRRRFSERRQQP